MEPEHDTSLKISSNNIKHSSKGSTKKTADRAKKDAVFTNVRKIADQAEKDTVKYNAKKVLSSKRNNISVNNDDPEEMQSSIERNQGESHSSIEPRYNYSDEDSKHIKELFQYTISNNITENEINIEQLSSLNESDQGKLQSYTDLDTMNCGSIKLHDDASAKCLNISGDNNQLYEDSGDRRHILSKKLVEATTNNITRIERNLETLSPIELSNRGNNEELQVELTLSMEQTINSSADSDAKLLQISSPMVLKKPNVNVGLEDEIWLNQMMESILKTAEMKKESVVSYSYSPFKKETFSFDDKISMKLERLQSQYNLLIEKHVDRFQLLSKIVCSKEAKLLDKIKNITAN